MLRKNLLKAKLARGEVVFAAWLDMDEILVGILGDIGFDAIVLEWEHATKDLAGLRHLILAAEAFQIPAIVRLRDQNGCQVQQFLEAGAAGILFADIRTRKDAEQAVRLCKFPPAGSRGSYSVARDNAYNAPRFGEYVTHANNEVFVGLIVEGEQGANNIDEIAAVDGVDVIMFGPGDTSLELGLPQQYEHPRVRALRDRVVEGTKKAGKGLWLYLADPTRPQDAVAQVNMGGNIISYPHDVAFIRKAYESTLITIKETLGSKGAHGVVKSVNTEVSGTGK